MSLPNYKRQSYNGITITSGLEEMSLPNYRRQSYNGITITSGVEEISLPNYSRPMYNGIISLVRRKCHYLITAYQGTTISHLV